MAQGGKVGDGLWVLGSLVCVGRNDRWWPLTGPLGELIPASTLALGDCPAWDLPAGARYHALLIPSCPGALADLASSGSLARILQHFRSENSR